MKRIKSGVFAPLFAVAMLCSTSSAFSMQWVLEQAAKRAAQTLFTSKPLAGAVAAYGALELLKRGACIATSVAGLIPRAVIPARVTEELKKRPKLKKSLRNFTRAKYLNRAQNVVLFGTAAYGVYNAARAGYNVYNGHQRRFDELAAQSVKLQSELKEKIEGVNRAAEERERAAQADRANNAQAAEQQAKAAHAEREQIAQHAQEERLRLAAENEARQKQMAEENDKKLEAAKLLLQQGLADNSRRLQTVQMSQAMFMVAGARIDGRLTAISQGALAGIGALQGG